MPRVTWVRMLKLWIDWDFICYKTSSLWGPFLWNHLHCLTRALVTWYYLFLICHNLLPTLFVTEQLFSLRGRCSWTILHHLFLKSVSQFTHFQNVAYIFRVCNWESVSTLTYLNYCWGCRFLVNLFRLVVVFPYIRLFHGVSHLKMFSSIPLISLCIFS